MKMVYLVLFPVTIHLANHQFSHVQFEGILLQNSLRDLQGMIHLDHRLLWVLAMLRLLDLLPWAYSYVVFYVHVLAVLLRDEDLNHDHDWICLMLVMLVNGAS